MPDKRLTPDQIARNRQLLQFVHKWLKYRDLNQTHIANKLGTSEPSVSKYLAGKQTMSIDKFLLIAELLEITPAALTMSPESEGRAERYRALAEAAAELPDDRLATLVASAKAMKPGE